MSIVAVPGIFRTTGSIAKVKSLKQAWNYKYDFYTNQEQDVQTVASCFKLWLRDLKVGVIPKSHFAECMEASTDKFKLKKAFRKLPKVHFDTLEYILEFLLKLSANADVNKMTISNIAIVFGPCLVRINANDDQLALLMRETVEATNIIKSSLEEFAFLFDKPVQKNSQVHEMERKVEDIIQPNVAEESAKLMLPFFPDEDSVSSM